MCRFRFRSVASGGSLVSLLSAALLASAALPLRTASAATVPVMNCNDSGVGSLRGSIASAHSGDTVDVRRLACRRIRLTSGEIRITQHDLTIVGPGRSRLVVDGNHASRVFFHDAPDAPDTLGTLVVKSMTIANGGSASAENLGGCVATTNNLELHGVSVHGCVGSSGGGAFAAFDMRLINSNVFGNVSHGDGGGALAETLVAYRSRIYGNSAMETGGGVFALDMRLSYTTIDGNSSQKEGGGAYCDGRLIVNKSTISNNRVALQEWGYTGGGAWGRDINVFDSTISGNEASYGSALWARDLVRIANSTIAFNRETQTGPESAGAVVVYHFTTLVGGSNAAAPLAPYTVSSSIIARNRWNGRAGNDLAPDFSYFVHGANNIIERSPIPVPADTMAVNPLLAPLANNGGPTRTHALCNCSPAIDRGSNLRHRQYDQRGPGFPREVGPAPDIGAFELQATDTAAR